MAPGRNRRRPFCGLPRALGFYFKCFLGFYFVFTQLVIFDNFWPYYIKGLGRGLFDDVILFEPFPSKTTESGGSWCCGEVDSLLRVSQRELLNMTFGGGCWRV